MDNKKNNNNITAKDVKILVAYHKPAVLVKNEILTPIHLGRALGNEISKDGALSNEDYQWMLDNMIGDDTGDNISNKNRRYNELTAIYWAWKNQDKLGNPKYIGLMHYRRQLVFNTQQEDYYKENNYIIDHWNRIDLKLPSLNITEFTKKNIDCIDILEALEKYDVIAPTPSIIGDTPVEHYKSPHSTSLGHVAEDFDLMVRVINKLYPEFNNVTNAYLNKNLHYWCNMFVMPAADFNHYCQWLFNILFEIEKQIDYSNRNALQQRALGFLAECLTGIYITYLQQKHSINHKYMVLHTNTDLIKPINPSFSNNNIPIVFSCDNNYAPYLAVAIQSIIENASSNNNYDIFVLDEEFKQATKTKILLQIKNKPNVNITFVAIKPYLQHLDANIFYTSSHIKIAAYYRLFIPRIFSNFSKVIYLDCDLVTVTDVAELYHTNLKNKMLGVVFDTEFTRMYINKDKYINNHIVYQNKVQANPYFNSGVLLFNITKANANNFEEACINKLIELKNPSCHDQDVLNALYQTDALFLSEKWNVEWHLPIWRTNLINELPSNLYNTYMASRENPFIVHYTGAIKPWHSPHLPLANYFWQYAKNTVFYEEVLFTNINKNIATDNNYAKQHLYAQKILAKKHKKLKYKLIYKLSFGKLRKKYKNKYKTLKAQIKQAKSI